MKQETRPGRTVEPFGLPAPPDHFHLSAKDRRPSTLDRQPWTARGAAVDSVKPTVQAYPLTAQRSTVLEIRKPLLLLRLSGVFLLRFADRRFCGLLLLNEPPRRTRETGCRPTNECTVEEPCSQTPRVRLRCVSDPRTNPASHVGWSQAASPDFTPHNDVGSFKPRLCFKTTVGRLSESSFPNEDHDSERLCFLIWSAMTCHRFGFPCGLSSE